MKPRYRLTVPWLAAAVLSGSAASAASPGAGHTRKARVPPAARAVQKRLETALSAEIENAKRSVYPALVNILVVYRYYDNGHAFRSLAGGSGVIISSDGYVVTNYHVAGHTTHIDCTLTTGEQIEASDVYDDPLTDISVLKLQRRGGAGRLKPLPYATLGNSDAARVGDFVLAMGNPLMLSSSLTLGVVSNTRRVFTDFQGTRLQEMDLDEGETTGTLTRWIQHDALILPGNSGGPLVNMQGQVIGINELGGGGQGFAIPSNLVRSVFQQVVHTGKLVRGFLGLTPLPVGKLHRKAGTLIGSVLPDSPAARAGLKPGDILLSLNGEPTNARYLEELPLIYQRTAALRPGTVVSARIARGGAVRTVNLDVGVMPPSLGREQEIPSMGLTVRPVTPIVALRMQLPDARGLVITGVRPGYPADNSQPKLQEDDIIRSVNGTPTSTVAALDRALSAAAGKSALVLATLRKDEHRLTIVTLKQPPADQNGGELPLAWIGIQTQVVLPEVAVALGHPGLTGFLVTDVYPYTQAAASGLKVGDVITELNGEPLQATLPQDSENLMRGVEQLTPGVKAKLAILRDGKRQIIQVELQPAPAPPAQEQNYTEKAFEFTVRDLSLMDKITRHLPENQSGVIVSDTTDGGWATLAGLANNDLILSVNGSAVTDVAGFKRLMASVRADRPRVVTLFVRRGYLTTFVFIEPDWTHLSMDE